MSVNAKPLLLDLLGAESAGADQTSLAATAPAMDARKRVEGWFREYFDTLWRLAARLGVPPVLLDDVVQEAFITAERRASDIEDGSARKFLMGTIVRLSANCRRYQAVRNAPLDPSLAGEPPPDAEQTLANKQLRRWLDLVLEQLPPAQRSVLVLHELEDQSVPEIAELLELPLGTVASRLGRARAKFSRAASRLRASAPVDVTTRRTR